MNEKFETVSSDTKIELLPNEQKLLMDIFGAIHTSPERIEGIIQQAKEQKKK